jgi:thymidylate synthase ThyX
MAGMGMKEAVVGKETLLPGHLKIGWAVPGPEVRLHTSETHQHLIAEAEYLAKERGVYVRSPRGYLDPSWNQFIQVTIEFQCSWAVARDWHRHRTAYPWNLDIVSSSEHMLRLHKSYPFVGSVAVKMDGPVPRYAQLLVQSSELFKKFKSEGDMEKAMLCLPLGTLVSMTTTMGLRDAVYMLELRANAHGANFEYERQAKEALKQLRKALGPLAEKLLI